MEWATILGSTLGVMTGWWLLSPFLPWRKPQVRVIKMESVYMSQSWMRDHVYREGATGN